MTSQFINDMIDGVANKIYKDKDGNLYTYSSMHEGPSGAPKTLNLRTQEEIYCNLEQIQKLGLQRLTHSKLIKLLK